MAVLLVSESQTFVGLSTDTKPTSVPIGSEFFAYNTGVTYVTHDGTNWVVFGISQYSY